MCGLAGILSARIQDPSTLEEAVSSMAGALVHRGPDDGASWVDPKGFAALGFRRLSILDLSPSGRQPMTSPSGRFTMAFNGEVYNFERLRSELPEQTYRGTSDTEVILHSFERWGVRAALERFVGMFAIAVWDHENEELWLVRDRLGIKPLYLARTPSGVAFASELKALFRAPGFEPVLDVDAVHAFLEYLYFPAPSTPFTTVRKLEPGHLLRLSPRRIQGEELPSSEPWWSLDDVRDRGQVSRGSSSGPGSEEACIDRLESLLADAVGLRMIADVPVGALLSGGIDSSLIVALMQRQASRPVRTFTIGFDDPDHDESAPARQVAAHLGTDHTELEVTGRDAMDLVPRLSGIFDEPLADPSQLPTYLVCELARRSVTVALSGDGGDELFAGYTRHTSGQRILPRVSRWPAVPRRWLGSMIQAVPAGAWDRCGDLTPGSLGRVRLAGAKAHKLGRVLTAPTESEMYRTLLRTGITQHALLSGSENPHDPVREALDRSGSASFHLEDMLLSDQRHYLPDDLLQKVDRASMAVSLEMRVPLLDHRVVEFSWTLPDRMKVRGHEGKWILRRLLDRHVPPALVDRPKTGFTVPIERWLGGPLKGWAEHLLLADDPLRDALFRPDRLRRSWTRFRSGRKEEALGLWAIVTLLAWRSHWGIENLTRRAA